MEPSTTTEIAIKNNDFWKTHFEQFKLSQLSKAGYAEKHGLVKHQFIYWARKFDKALKKSVATPSDFIPITIKQPSAITNNTMPNIPILCTLQLSDGKKLLLHSESALKLCLESWR